MNFGLEKKFHARTLDILLDLAGPLVLREAGISCSEYTHTVTSLVLCLLKRLVDKN